MIQSLKPFFFLVLIHMLFCFYVLVGGCLASCSDRITCTQTVHAEDGMAGQWNQGARTGEPWPARLHIDCCVQGCAVCISSDISSECIYFILSVSTFSREITGKFLGEAFRKMPLLRWMDVVSLNNCTKANTL